ncbi:hypothetical protein Bbelb_291300 [Branchiostoma belcheri]|nr:hypothetical protein Bbelb_291300 [Branchiostoma belcheri]
MPYIRHVSATPTTTRPSLRNSRISARRDSFRGPGQAALEAIDKEEDYHKKRKQSIGYRMRRCKLRKAKKQPKDANGQEYSTDSMHPSNGWRIWRGRLRAGRHLGHQHQIPTHPERGMPWVAVVLAYPEGWHIGKVEGVQEEKVVVTLLEPGPSGHYRWHYMCHYSSTIIYPIKLEYLSTLHSSGNRPGQKIRAGYAMPITTEEARAATHEEMTSPGLDLTYVKIIGFGDLEPTRHFVDPVTEVHTQQIESYWNRKKLKAMHGCMGEETATYLTEEMWRERYATTSREGLQNILADIAEQYHV